MSSISEILVLGNMAWVLVFEIVEVYSLDKVSILSMILPYSSLNSVYCFLLDYLILSLMLVVYDKTHDLLLLNLFFSFRSILNFNFYFSAISCS